MTSHGDDSLSEASRHQDRQSPLRKRRVAKLLGVLELAEDGVHLVVAIVLMAVAVLVLYQYGNDFLRSSSDFSVRVTEVTNGVLFVIILMELLRTVVTHFDFEGFQLKPFLIIGIISAVRHILTVGARESLGAAEQGSAFQRARSSLPLYECSHKL